MTILQSEIKIIVARLLEEGGIAATTWGEITDDVQAEGEAFVRLVLERAGAPLQKQRMARVDGDGAGERVLREVKKYLPSNYHALLGGECESDVIIIGYDAAGWTLDDYVIPRLASGLIVAEEVK